MVYERTELRSAEGEILESTEQGVWNPDLAERVARPWLHVPEGLVHDDEAWHLEHPDGTVESGYRVTVVMVDPSEPEASPPVPVISGAVADALAALDPNSEAAVMVEFAGWTSPPLPWVPDEATVSPLEYEAALAHMKAVGEEQRVAFELSTSGLATAVEEAGGSVEGYLWSVGWIAVSIPVLAIDGLAAHPDVRRIELDQPTEDGSADPVPLGDLRVLTGSQDYADAGYSGAPCQPFCIGLMLGVMEGQGYEDEGCFQGNSSCTPGQRLRERFTCSSSACASSDFAESEESFHGTFVTSIAMGSYVNGQAAGKEPYIASGLTGWENDATGFARHARLDYYRAGNDSAKATAYACARGSGSECSPVTVLNQSSGTSPNGSNECNASSWLAIEGAMENAWDAGVLPVVITHNDNDYPSSDQCRVRTPADMPKAFAVGAVDPSFTLDYHDWPYAGFSNRGGGTSKVWLLNAYYPQVGAVSMVDLVASGLPGYVTDHAGVWGTISVNGPYNIGFGGHHVPDPATSFAGPQVAGAALQVKHGHLALGYTWISNPGRLHAAMLTMGDRATFGSIGATQASCVSNGRIRCGADRYYGLGRLTLRRHMFLWMRTRTFTSSTSLYTDERLFGSTPLPSSIRLVKCAMQQAEDMVDPDKDNISRIGLQVQIRGVDPQTSTCQLDQGVVYHTIADSLPDDKHMVAVTDAEVSLAGRCVQARFTKHSLSSASSVMTNTYCVADDELDYE